MLSGNYMRPRGIIRQVGMLAIGESRIDAIGWSFDETGLSYEKVEHWEDGQIAIAGYTIHELAAIVQGCMVN